MMKCVLLLLLIVGWAWPVQGQDGGEPTRTLIYKIASGDSLALHVFEPPGHQVNHRRAAIVFFFGGGWRQGSPGQFYRQAERLANQGMVAISAEYRVKDRHGTTPFECVEDGQSAIAWVRTHAAELGVDADRIVAAGGSAGGHVAAATGTVPGDPSSKPNLLVLFNPVVDPAALAERFPIFGDRVLDISPAHHTDEQTPPTLIFHGTDDTTVPFDQVEAFCDNLHRIGNLCTVMPFEGEGHGFFNHGRGDGQAFEATMEATERFLTTFGYLDD